MANSPEYRVMISSTKSLVDVMVAEGPKAVSDDLVGQELITYDLYKEMSLDSKTSEDKARKLVQAVTDKVKCNPSENFSKFLVVLKKHNMSDLEAALKSKHGDLVLRERPVAAVDTTDTPGAANNRDGSGALDLEGDLVLREGPVAAVDTTDTPGAANNTDGSDALDLKGSDEADNVERSIESEPPTKQPRVDEVLGDKETYSSSEMESNPSKLRVDSLSTICGTTSDAGSVTPCTTCTDAVSKQTVPDFSLKSLILLKWTDSNGRPRNLRLRDEMCADWQDIGDLLEISPIRLTEIRRSHLYNPKMCCRDILLDWLQMDECSYPVNWDGMLRLLVDIGLSAIADKLQEALKHYQ